MSDKTPRELNRQIRGDHAFNENTVFSGQITGNAAVGVGVQLELRGQICGDLHVGQGADVVIYGQVTGTLFNHDGRVLIFGDVSEIEDHSTRSGMITLAGAVRARLASKERAKDAKAQRT